MKEAGEERLVAAGQDGLRAEVAGGRGRQRQARAEREDRAEGGSTVT